MINTILNKKMSLRNKFFFSYFLIILLILGIIGSIILLISQQILINQIGKSEAKVLSCAGNNISSLCHGVISAASLYAFNDDLGEIISKPISEDKYTQLLDTRRIRELFSTYMDAFEKLDLKYYAVLYAYNGYRINTLNIENAYDFNSVIQRKWYQDVVDNDGVITWISTYNDKKGCGKDVYVFTASRLIKHLIKNEPLGILNINVYETVLYDVYKESLIDDNQILILDSLGNVVSNSDRNNVGVNLYHRDYLQQILDDKESGYKVVEYKGKEILVAYNYMNELDWMLLEEIPLSTVFSPFKRYKLYVLELFLLCIFIAVVLSYIIAYRITRPVKKLCDVMQEVGTGDLTVQSEINASYEIQQLSDRFNNMLNQINVLMDDSRKKEELKRQAEIKFLQVQINPHMMYNTLNSIRCMIAIGENDKAEDMMITFIRLLRNSLNSNRQIVSLQDEINNLKDYVKIQQFKYVDKFDVEYDIDEAVLNAGVPKLILQPIIENAIFHGIEPKCGKGKIVINAFLQDANLIIDVIDDGIGIENSLIEHFYNNREDVMLDKVGHIGIANVHNRLVSSYGEKYGVDLERLLQGTKITLKIPYDLLENDWGAFK